MPAIRNSTPITPDGPIRPPGGVDVVPPRRPPRWREQVVGASGLNVLAGLWLVASPWLLGYDPEDAAWNPVVFGSIVVLLAAVRVRGAWGASILSWINSLIGVWLFVSAFRARRVNTSRLERRAGGGDRVLPCDLERERRGRAQQDRMTRRAMPLASAERQTSDNWASSACAV